MGPSSGGVMTPWALPFLWWVLDVSRPMRGLMHELDLPDADQHANAFEKRCYEARLEAYEALEELRYAYICKHGQEADRARYLAGKEKRAQLNQPKNPVVVRAEAAPPEMLV